MWFLPVDGGALILINVYRSHYESICRSNTPMIDKPEARLRTFDRFKFESKRGKNCPHYHEKVKNKKRNVAVIGVMCMRVANNVRNNDVKLTKFS